MAGHKTTPQRGTDWHKADIKAALEKAGWTLRSLANHHNISHGTLTQALRFSYPAAERRIAEALSLHPKVIWPSRYHANGTPSSQRGNPNWIATAPARKNRSTGAKARHVKSARAG